MKIKNYPKKNNEHDYRIYDLKESPCLKNENCSKWFTVENLKQNTITKEWAIYNRCLGCEGYDYKCSLDDLNKEEIKKLFIDVEYGYRKEIQGSKYYEPKYKRKYELFMKEYEKFKEDKPNILISKITSMANILNNMYRRIQIGKNME